MSETYAEVEITATVTTKITVRKGRLDRSSPGRLQQILGTAMRERLEMMERSWDHNYFYTPTQWDVEVTACLLWWRSPSLSGRTKMSASRRSFLTALVAAPAALQVLPAEDLVEVLDGDGLPLIVHDPLNGPRSLTQRESLKATERARWATLCRLREQQSWDHQRTLRRMKHLVRIALRRDPNAGGIRVVEDEDELALMLVWRKDCPDSFSTSTLSSVIGRHYPLVIDPDTIRNYQEGFAEMRTLAEALDRAETGFQISSFRYLRELDSPSWRLRLEINGRVYHFYRSDPRTPYWRSEHSPDPADGVLSV